MKLSHKYAGVVSEGTPNDVKYHPFGILEYLKPAFLIIRPALQA